jgi:hypothetical protein
MQARQLEKASIAKAPLQTSRVEGAPAARLSRAAPVLLQLQKKYGNRYVQAALARARQGPGETEAPAEVGETIERQRALGQPLDRGVRAQMEPAFGTGFHHVRVHTGMEADRLNRAVNARAFTTGRDIFFRTGEYSPHSYGGRELLAHELTHVVQQTGTVRPKLMISQPGDSYEQEADRIARAVMQRETLPAGQTRQPTGVSSIHLRVQRQLGFLSDAVGNITERASNYIRERAQSIPGYELIGVILGRDPITQRPVERNATNLLRGLLSLIPGGTQMFENLQQSGVIQRAFTWVTGELARLNLTWPVIRGAIERFLGSLEVSDVLNLGRVFERARAIFSPIVSNLVSFARAAGSRILEFIFEGALVLGGSAGQRILGIFRRIGASFSLIVNDPVRFLQNLIGSVAGAFRQFGGNILSHLRTAIFEWLFGALQGTGLQLPQRFDLRGIVSIILQILGLTYARLRARLVRVIGERPVQILEGAFEFLQILVTQGIAAAWQKILEYAENLTDTVIEGIKSWIRNTIVMQAIQQIASLLTPVGAIIQAIIKIYNTVMFVIERAQQLAAFVTSVMESLENIARGNVSSAIAYVERTLARILPLVISFLARFVGLGGISARIREIIQRIQGVVDRAFDRVINWIRERARSLIERTPRSAGDLQVQVLQDVEQGLRTQHSRQEAEAIIRRIADKFRPAGLKRLELGPESAEGVSTLLFEASPVFPLGNLTRRATHRPAGRTVTSAIEITSAEPVNAAAGPFAPVSTRATVPHGGEVLSQRPQFSHVVNVVTWNTSDIDAANNDHHAERQFIDWLRAPARAELRQNIEKIVIRNISRSPCDMCSPMLANLLDTIRREQNPRRLTEAHIYWTTLHSGVSSTSWQGIRELQSAGWALHAPNNAWPPEPSHTAGELRWEGPPGRTARTLAPR